MKKTIISLLLSLFLVSCANTASSTKKVDPYSHITVENIKKNCKDAEHWNVSVLGMHGLVIQFDDCAGIKMLLVVATGAETPTEEIKRTSMRLLAMHYKEYLQRAAVGKEHNKVYSIKKIKEESGDGWLTFYYDITYKTIKCTGDTCKTQ